MLANADANNINKDAQVDGKHFIYDRIFGCMTQDVTTYLRVLYTNKGSIGYGEIYLMIIRLVTVRRKKFVFHCETHFLDLPKSEGANLSH